MATVRATIEPFTGGDFAEYQERLAFYFLANDIGVVASSASNAEKERVKKKMFAHLISSLSKDVYATLKSLCLPTSPADKSFDEVCALLRDYYKVRRSATTASYQFRSCVQHQAGERIVDFCNRLKRAAVPCQFGDHLDRALKDQFVAGLASSDIKRKILTSADADTNKFADVVQIAEREESAITYAGQLTPGASSVNKLHTRSSPNRTAPNRTTDQRDHRGRGTTTNTSTKKCFRCTSDLHMANKCPHRNTECRFCKKTGHLERACLAKRKRAGQVNHVGDEAEPEETRVL
eukprot:scpid91167/ scgid13601/ 